MLQPGADGDAAHLGERRLRQAVQGEGDVADVAHHRQLVRALPRLVAAEVGARAEVTTGTGQHHDPVGGALADLVERRQQLVPHRPVDRVLALRPAERDGDDTVLAADLDGFHAATILSGMGFDPQRRQVRRRTDYVFVGAAAVACIALLLWALLA